MGMECHAKGLWQEQVCCWGHTDTPQPKRDWQPFPGSARSWDQERGLMVQ